MTTQTIRRPAARYQDQDDCLTACAAEVAAEMGLHGWDLSPRWADQQREEILLDVPANARRRTVTAASIAAILDLVTDLRATGAEALRSVVVAAIEQAEAGATDDEIAATVRAEWAQATADAEAEQGA